MGENGFVQNGVLFFLKYTLKNISHQYQFLTSKNSRKLERCRKPSCRLITKQLYRNVYILDISLANHQVAKQLK